MTIGTSQTSRAVRKSLRLDQTPTDQKSRNVLSESASARTCPLNRDQVDEQAGYPGSGSAEELESNQVKRQHEEHARDDRGDLRGPLPVARAGRRPISR